MLRLNKELTDFVTEQARRFDMEPGKYLDDMVRSLTAYDDLTLRNLAAKVEEKNKLIEKANALIEDHNELLQQTEELLAEQNELHKQIERVDRRKKFRSKLMSKDDLRRAYPSMGDL